MNKKELIDLCRNGDSKAFELLYNIYSEKMMKICLRYVSDKNVAQDILHDGFIIVITSIKALRDPEKLESWMGTIMKNISLKYLNLKKTISIDSLSTLEEFDEPFDADSSESLPSYEELLNAVAELPEGYQKVFRLSVLEGLSHQQIGELLGIAAHSSSSQLFRAKKLIRKIISTNQLFIILILLLLMTPEIRLYKATRYSQRIKNTKTPREEEKLRDEALTRSLTRGGMPPLRQAQYTLSKSSADSAKTDSVLEKLITETKPKETRDTVYTAGSQTTIRKEKEPTYPIASTRYKTKSKKPWLLAISYYGEKNGTTTQRSTLNDDVSSDVPKKTTERVFYHMPVSFSLSLNKQLSEHWGIETGIRYVYLRTDIAYTGRISKETKQRVSYIGVPLKGTMQIGKHRNLSVYVSAGATIHIPIEATIKETIVESGETTTSHRAISTPLLWSLEFGTGIQYNITPSTGIFAEPNLNYYFSNESKLSTIRKEKPLDISLLIGIRFSF